MSGPDSDSDIEHLALNDASAIAAFLADELRAARPDAIFMGRVVTQELHRWFTNGLTDAQIQRIADVEAGPTGSPRWDALLEGSVAYKINSARARGGDLKRPEWTRRTKLGTGWSPHDALYRDDDWYKLLVLRTSVELLDKGVVFSRDNFQRV